MEREIDSSAQSEVYTVPARAILCSLGLIDHDWKRVRGRDRSGDLRCPTCKTVYDPSVFGPEEPLTHCPRDGAEVMPASTSMEGALRSIKRGAADRLRRSVGMPDVP